MFKKTDFNKKYFLIFFIIFISSILGIIFYFYRDLPYTLLKKQKFSPKIQVTTHAPCLLNNESVDYTKNSPVISIKDKNTGKESFRFEIDNIDPAHYHPFEFHKCGVYVVKKFNYDPKRSEQAPGFKAELWKYQYNGNGDSLLILSEKSQNGIFKGYFSYDFRVDPLEYYIVLIKGYLGSPDYAIVIKDLKTLKDIFVLSGTEIEKQKPEIVGNISFNNWSDDSRYFWVDTHYGAVRLGFIHIDSSDWSYDIFAVPEGVLGGAAFNSNTGYITVHSNLVWYGVAEIYEKEKAERRKKGIGSELYIENLITGKRYFVVKTDEALWSFKPQWVSNTELEYTLPNGEKKIYKINEK